jgi:hypothetical protein
MKTKQMVNLLGVLGGIDYDDGSESFDCSLEKMQELKKVLDALEVEYQYKINEREQLTQYVVRISCVDDIDYVTIYTHQFKTQGL